MTLFDESSIPESMRLASELRARGLRVEMAPEATKLGKQLRYADRKGIPFALVLGPDEIEQGKVGIKDLRRGAQDTLDRADLADALRARLAASADEVESETPR